jgi:hypothetical protein
MRINLKYNNCWVLICLGTYLMACQNHIFNEALFKEALTLAPECLADRKIQTRVFAGIDEKRLLTASAAVLQDLGYTIDETEVRCGVIVCSRDRDVTETGQVVLSVILTILASAMAGTPVSVPYDTRQKVLASLVTAPASNQSVAVRITFQQIIWNSDGKISKNNRVNESQIYQEFFSKLSKSVFLVAHEI